MGDAYTDLPLGISTGEARSGFIGDADLVNLMVVRSPPGSPKPFHFESTPAFVSPAGSGTGETTCAIIHGDYIWYVRGTELYRYDGTTATKVGNVASASRYFMTGSGLNEIFLADGNGNHYQATTSAVNTVTPPVTLSRCAAIDGRVVAIRPGTDEWYISNQDDATTWGALDFSTADAIPDRLVNIAVVNQQVILFGEEHAEFWYNAGASPFPFVRSQPGVEKTGCTGGVAVSDGVTYFIGKEGRVYAMRGYDAQPISPDWVERYLTHLLPNQAYGTVYSYRGQTFYAPAQSGTAFQLIYSITNNAWHRITAANNGELQIFGGGNHRNTGAGKVLLAINTTAVGMVNDVHTLDGDTFRNANETVGGNPANIERILTLPAHDGGGRRIFEGEIEVVMARTPGVTGTVTYEFSDDGGATYVQHGTSATQATDQARVRFLRGGSYHRRIRRLTVSANARVAIESVRARFEAGA